MLETGCYLSYLILRFADVTVIIQPKPETELIAQSTEVHQLNPDLAIKAVQEVSTILMLPYTIPIGVKVIEVKNRLMSYFTQI